MILEPTIEKCSNWGVGARLGVGAEYFKMISCFAIIMSSSITIKLCVILVSIDVVPCQHIESTNPRSEDQSSTMEIKQSSSSIFGENTLPCIW